MSFFRHGAGVVALRNPSYRRRAEVNGLCTSGRNRKGVPPTKAARVTDPHSTNANVTRHILVAISLLAVAAIIWTASEVLVIAFGSVVFATVLRALAVPLARRTGWSERASLTVVVLLLIVLMAVFTWLFGRQLEGQIADMRQQLPAAVEKFKAWLAESRVGRMVVENLKQSAQDSSPLSGAGMAVSAVFGSLGNLLLMMFAGIYLAADPGLYRRGALRLLPPARRSQVGCALDDAGVALHQWLVAQIAVMLAVGVMTGGGLALLGVPLALSLGVLAGLLEFVPVVGPILSAVPGILLAFSAGPNTAFYALLVYVAVQQIESNVLTPIVQRWAVELPPVIALFSIVVCGVLFGVWGVIFATPMAVVVMAMVKHLYVEDTLENGNGASRPRRRR